MNNYYANIYIFSMGKVLDNWRDHNIDSSKDEGIIKTIKYVIEEEENNCKFFDDYILLNNKQKVLATLPAPCNPEADVHPVFIAVKNRKNEEIIGIIWINDIDDYSTYVVMDEWINLYYMNGTIFKASELAAFFLEELYHYPYINNNEAIDSHIALPAFNRNHKEKQIDLLFVDPWGGIPASEGGLYKEYIDEIGEIFTYIGFGCYLECQKQKELEMELPFIFNPTVGSPIFSSENYIISWDVSIQWNYLDCNQISGDLYYKGKNERGESWIDSLTYLDNGKINYDIVSGSQEFKLETSRIEPGDQIYFEYSADAEGMSKKYTSPVYTFNSVYPGVEVEEPELEIEEKRIKWPFELSKFGESQERKEDDDNLKIDIKINAPRKEGEPELEITQSFGEGNILYTSYENCNEGDQVKVTFTYYEEAVAENTFEFTNVYSLSIEDAEQDKDDDGNSFLIWNVYLKKFDQDIDLNTPGLYSIETNLSQQSVEINDSSIKLYYLDEDIHNKKAILKIKYEFISGESSYIFNEIEGEENNGE